jgi:uncharacterized protein YggE
MKKYLIIIMTLISLVLVAGLSGCDMYGTSSTDVVAQSINSDQDLGISVTGIGEVDVTPDLAILNLGVLVQMDSLSQAQQQAASSMNAIMNVLTGFSIADKDIHTAGYSIEPVWVWKDGEYIFSGYKVVNNISVKLRDMDKAGEVIDAAVEAGGEYVVVSGINFTVDDPKSYYTEARTEAMANAKEKANQLAKSAGVKVGVPISIAESNYYESRESSAFFVGASDGNTTSISPGELTITVTVNVVYTIGK